MRLVRSSVVPEGTAILLSTMVAQDFLDAEAAEAAVKVQDARFSRAFPISGAGVGRGAGAGLPAGIAATRVALLAKARRHALIFNIVQSIVEKRFANVYTGSRETSLYKEWMKMNGFSKTKEIGREALYVLKPVKKSGEKPRPKKQQDILGARVADREGLQGTIHKYSSHQVETQIDGHSSWDSRWWK